MTLLTTLLVAVSLSMDAFSLALIYGTFNIEIKKIMIISIMVGIFHFFMPYFGYYFGENLSRFININIDIFMTMLFLYLGVNMMFSVFKNEEIKISTNFIALTLFALTVSIDSFTIGIGLGLEKNNSYINYLIFSIVSFIFTLIGLNIGNLLSIKFGKLSNIVGSITLIILAITNLM